MGMGGKGPFTGVSPPDQMNAQSGLSLAGNELHHFKPHSSTFQSLARRGVEQVQVFWRN